MRQSPGEEAGGTPSRPPAAGPSNFLHCVARTCIAAFQRAHLVRLVPSSRWTEVVERERGLGNGTERPDLRPTSCTAIGCTPHHRCLPPATRRQGGHQAAPSANSHAPPESSTCKRDAASPTALVHHDVELQITGLGTLPHVQFQGSLADNQHHPVSSCQPQPARPTPTPTCLMQRPSQGPRQRHSTTITPSARSSRCSIWDVAAVMTLRAFHSPGSRPWPPLSPLRRETTAQHAPASEADKRVPTTHSAPPKKGPTQACIYTHRCPPSLIVVEPPPRA